MSDVYSSEHTNSEHTDVVIRFPAKPGHSTGPVTAEGKAKVSNNATNHGCTSSFSIVDGRLTPQAEARIVLPNENPAEWEATKDRWVRNYEAKTDLHVSLILQGAIADWLRQRTIRRYYEIEHHLFKHAADSNEWTAEQHDLLERFIRYMTRAERAYVRAYNAVEILRREKKRDLEKENASKAAPPAKTSPAASRSESRQEPEPESAATPNQSAIIQCITIQVVDGEALSVFQPRNEFLEQLILKCAEPKPIVKRALYFLDEVPAEYAWIPELENYQGRPHFVITRTSEEALRDLARELEEGAVHVLPLR